MRTPDAFLFLAGREWDAYESECDGWAAVLDREPASFTWTVDDTDDGGVMAHCEMPTPEAARALCDHVQSLGGSRLEADGAFVYVLCGEDEHDDVVQELRAAGFSVREV